MKTTSETTKEAIAEFDRMDFGFAGADITLSQKKSFSNIYRNFIKSHTIAILDSSIERLRGELYENKTSECNCRGWDNGIQKEIDDLTAEKVMIEKL